jgi:RNA polymerase sigma-70 factor (ECF subfamily)
MRSVDHAAEVEWIEKARLGDDEAFAALVGAYQVPVYNLCYRLLGDRYEAEDAAQEVFFKAYRNLGRYDSDRPLVNWLLRIASNHSIDRLRRRGSRPSIDLAEAESAVDGSPDPEAALALEERRQMVWETTRKLSPRDRALVVLRYWYDYSYEEMAEALSLSASAVRSRLHRARMAMAEHWREKQASPVRMGGTQDEPSAI